MGGPRTLKMADPMFSLAKEAIDERAVVDTVSQIRSSSAEASRRKFHTHPGPERDALANSAGVQAEVAERLESLLGMGRMVGWDRLQRAALEVGGPDLNAHNLVAVVRHVQARAREGFRSGDEPEQRYGPITRGHRISANMHAAALGLPSSHGSLQSSQPQHSANTGDTAWDGFARSPANSPQEQPALPVSPVDAEQRERYAQELQAWNTKLSASLQAPVACTPSSQELYGPSSTSNPLPDQDSDQTPSGDYQQADHCGDGLGFTGERLVYDKSRPVLARDTYGMLFVKDKHADAEHKHSMRRTSTQSKTCHNEYISALGNDAEWHLRMAANIEANKEEAPAAIVKPVPTQGNYSRSSDPAAPAGGWFKHQAPVPTAISSVLGRIQSDVSKMEASAAPAVKGGWFRQGHPSPQSKHSGLGQMDATVGTWTSKFGLGRASTFAQTQATVTK